MNLHKYSIYRSMYKVFRNPMRYGILNYLKHLYYVYRTPIAVHLEKRKLNKDPYISYRDFLNQ